MSDATCGRILTFAFFFMTGCSDGGTSSSGSGGNGTTTSGGASTSGGSGGSSGGSSSSGGSAVAGSASGGASATGGSSGASGGSSGTGGSGGGTALPTRVLLYSFSTLDIPSVPAQLTLLEGKLQGLGYDVEKSVDPAAFTAENLARFAAVGMINTCFEPFGVGNSGDAETAVLKAFVSGGGGLFGTHCAAVTFQSADPPAAYNNLIGGRGGGGYYDGTSTCHKVLDHPTTSALPAEFSYTGNLDNSDYVAADTTVLVKCTWGAPDTKEVSTSWYRPEGQGRVFFTNFGKVDSDLSDPVIGEDHIIAGLHWVLGL